MPGVEANLGENEEKNYAKYKTFPRPNWAENHPYKDGTFNNNSTSSSRTWAKANEARSAEIFYGYQLTMTRASGVIA